MTCHIPDVFLEVGPTGLPGIARHRWQIATEGQMSDDITAVVATGLHGEAVPSSCTRLFLSLRMLDGLLSGNLVVQDVGNIVTPFLLHQHNGCQYLGGKDHV